MSWRTEVLEPSTMSTADIRAELRHDLNVHDRVQDPVSKMAMAARINELVIEMDARTQGVEEHPASSQGVEE